MDAATLVAALQSVPYVGPVAVWLPVVGVACAAIDAALPQPAAGSAWAPVRQLISWAGLNLGHAKNAAPPAA